MSRHDDRVVGLDGLGPVVVVSAAVGRRGFGSLEARLGVGDVYPGRGRGRLHAVWHAELELGDGSVDRLADAVPEYVEEGVLDGAQSRREYEFEPVAVVHVHASAEPAVACRHLRELRLQGQPVEVDGGLAVVVGVSVLHRDVDVVVLLAVDRVAEKVPLRDFLPVHDDLDGQVPRDVACRCRVRSRAVLGDGHADRRAGRRVCGRQRFDRGGPFAGEVTGLEPDAPGRLSGGVARDDAAVSRERVQSHSCGVFARRVVLPVAPAEGEQCGGVGDSASVVEHLDSAVRACGYHDSRRAGATGVLVQLGDGLFGRRVEERVHAADRGRVDAGVDRRRQRRVGHRVFLPSSLSGLRRSASRRSSASYSAPRP